MRLTNVVEVVGAFIEVPISVPVVAEAQWRQRAVSPVDDLETVWTLREVVVDDDVLIPLYAKKRATNISPISYLTYFTHVFFDVITLKL